MSHDRIHCDFCSRGLEEVDWLFRSEIGGLPPAICSGCVGGFAEVAKLLGADPDAAAKAIAEHNAAIDSGRRAGSPGNWAGADVIVAGKGEW